jgi:hypothetical protein
VPSSDSFSGALTLLSIVHAGELSSAEDIKCALGFFDSDPSFRALLSSCLFTTPLKRTLPAQVVHTLRTNGLSTAEAEKCVTEFLQVKALKIPHLALSSDFDTSFKGKKAPDNVVNAIVWEHVCPFFADAAVQTNISSEQTKTNEGETEKRLSSDDPLAEVLKRRDERLLEILLHPEKVAAMPATRQTSVANQVAESGDMYVDSLEDTAEPSFDDELLDDAEDFAALKRAPEENLSFRVSILRSYLLPPIFV